MYRGEIDAPPFIAYLNGEIIEMDWLQRLNITVDSLIGIGVDQSSTCTGFSMHGKDFLFITELPRGDMSMYMYKQVLTTQFDRFIGSNCLSRFIFEKHGRHIAPLEALINDITKQIKSYTKPMHKDGVMIKGVLPTVWRSGFLPKEKYAGQYKREQVKLACVHEAVSQFPGLALYKDYAYKKSTGTDYDGFEALGIEIGYTNLNFDAQGNRIVNTTMERKAGRKFKYLIEVTNINNKQDSLDYIQAHYVRKRPAPVLLANPLLLIDNMINRVLDEFDECIIELTDHPELPRLVIETEREWSPELVYLIYVRKE